MPEYIRKTVACDDSLVTARWLHQMNLALNTADPGRLEDYIAGHAERTRAWMRT